MVTAILITAAACLVGCYLTVLSFALRGVSRRRLSQILVDRGRSLDEDGYADRVARDLLVIGALRAVLGLLLVISLLASLRYAPATSQWHILTRYAVALAGGTLLVSVFFVALPASIARYHREAIVAGNQGVLRVIRVMFAPLALTMIWVDPLVQRIIGIDAVERADDFDLSDEVMTVVEDHEGADVAEEQKEMLEAVFDLPKTTAEEIMTPRTDVKGLEVGATLDEVKAFILEAGHSRIPVYENSLDTIRGILYAKDLIQFVGDGETFDIESLLREPLMVPESKPVTDLLRDFKSTKVHMAIVVDEYGGTAGLITIEDIIEELVGEIQDEYEEPEEQPQFVPVGDGIYDVDARAYIDDVNDKLEASLPEDEDYDTLGGLVVSALGHIPVAGEAFVAHELRFTVTEAERTRVKRVRVEPAPEGDESETPEPLEAAAATAAESADLNGTD